MNYSIAQLLYMGMKIQSAVAINDRLLLVYSLAETSYYFSIIDVARRAYTCDTSFPCANSAKFMGVAAIKRVTESERNYE